MKRTMIDKLLSRSAALFAARVVVLIIGIAWLGFRYPAAADRGEQLIDPEQIVDPEEVRQYLEEWPIPPLGKLALEVGDRFPSMAAEGWLNGGPPKPGELAGKVIVIDIWNEL